MNPRQHVPGTFYLHFQWFVYTSGLTISYCIFIFYTSTSQISDCVAYFARSQVPFDSDSQLWLRFELYCLSNSATKQLVTGSTETVTKYLKDHEGSICWQFIEQRMQSRRQVALPSDEASTPRPCWYLGRSRSLQSSWKSAAFCCGK